MMGTSHKTIGTAVGIAMVLYAINTKEPMLAIGMVTAPIGAMLPDIDHHNSKIGKTKNEVMVTMTRVCVVVTALLLALFCSGLCSSIRLFSFIDGRAVVCVASGTVMLIVIQSKWFRDKYPFLCKHRCIFHTLVLPALLSVYVIFQRVDGFIAGAVFGIVLGYVSHLVADCLTVEGCPIAFPITTRDVGVPLLSTDTKAEKLYCAIVSGLIILYGYSLTNTAMLRDGFTLFIAVVSGMGTGVLLKKKSVKLSKVMVVTILLASILIVYFLFAEYCIQYVVFTLSAVFSLLKTRRTKKKKK